MIEREPSTHIVNNIDPNQHAIKKKVWEEDGTKRSLIDYVSCLPEMATKAAKSSNIMHGFYECGLHGKGKSRFPVVTKQ